MGRETFVSTFGALYEHSPWVAEEAFVRGITVDHDHPDRLAQHLAAVMLDADRERQLALICAHPELAPKPQTAATMADHSRSEQRRAGLGNLDDGERAVFAELNRTYRERFGFPFIIAVAGLRADQIRAEFERRLTHVPDEEFQTALAQINRIAAIRLQQWWANTTGKD